MRRRRSQAKYKARLKRLRVSKGNDRDLTANAGLVRKRLDALDRGLISAKHEPREGSATAGVSALEVEKPSTAPALRHVVAADLIAAVNGRSGDSPIVWSNQVRDYFAANHLLTGERREDPSATRNGRHFERADHDACSSGELQKWKRSNGTVGWSRSRTRDEAAYLRAVEAAVAGGVLRLDYAGSNWTALRFDAASGGWR